MYMPEAERMDSCIAADWLLVAVRALVLVCEICAAVI